MKNGLLVNSVELCCVVSPQVVKSQVRTYVKERLYLSSSSKLPMADSFSLADKLREEASGDVHWSVCFSGFEVLDEDPFYEQALSQSELEDVNCEDLAENISRKMLNLVRRRKGLATDEKIIKEYSDKQRTITKMK